MNVLGWITYLLVPQNVIVFKTLFSDQSDLLTTSWILPRLIKVKGREIVSVSKNTALAEMYAAHLEKMRFICQEKDVHPVPFTEKAQYFDYAKLSYQKVHSPSSGFFFAQ